MVLMPKQASAYALTLVPIPVTQTAHARVRQTASTVARTTVHAFPQMAVKVALTKHQAHVYAPMDAKTVAIIKAKNAYACPHVLTDATSMAHAHAMQPV